MIKKRITIPWSDKEKDYLIRRVTKDMVHPSDLQLELNERFGFKRTYSAIKTKLRDSGISYMGLLTDKQKNKTSPKVVKTKIREDVEKARLQQKIEEVTSKYKILVKERSLGDRMIQALRDEARVLPKISLAWKPPEEKISKEESVLLLGDTEIGEIVEKEAVHGFGEYNFDIFVKRIKFLAESIKSITIKKLKGYQVDTLHIFLLGDMVSGIIHDELRENAEEMIFQVLNGAYVIAQFILELKRMFSEIFITGVVGNHGRIQQQKRFKKRYTNFDFILYQFLELFLSANDDIKCYFPKSFFTVKKIYGWNFLVLHGDNIRSWAGIPWYGIERAMWRLGDLLQGKGINIDYRILGHFHNTGEIDKTPGEIIINGTMVGGSEYSLGSIFEFGRPTQLFFGVHKDIGVTWRYPLRLDLKEISRVEPYKYNKELQAGKYMKDLLNTEI